MGRAADIEAFARLLDGAPASSVPSSVSALGRTVSALQAIPAPALPAGLAGGGLALLSRANLGTGGAHTAAAAHAVPAGTRIAGVTHTAGTATSKLAAAKATVFGMLTAHLVPVVAGTAVLAVGATGVAVGASRSLPGDPLYGLKRATESVQSATTTTKVSAAERQLDVATIRLHEALALQARGTDPAAITTEVNEWLTDVSSAVKVLQPLVATPAVKAKLAAFVAANTAGLAQFPAAAVAPAVAAVTQIDTLLSTTVTHVTTQLPVHRPTTGTTASPRPVTIPTALPNVVTPLHLPTALPSVAAKLPSLRPVAPSAAGAVPTLARPATLPSLAPPATLPSLAQPSALPSITLPTALPSIPVPSVSDVTTLLQGLAPKH